MQDHPTGLPQPTPTTRDRARRQLEARLGSSKVLVDPAACDAYAGDDSGAPGRLPDAVVFAETVADVRAVLEIARASEVPVTPRAAGTGRTGGAVTVAGGIVLSCVRRNGIVDIDRAEGIVVVEPGVVLADLHAAVEREGWFYPPDPNSSATCTLGGNLAENAGGPRAFKYGVTRDYVLGADVSLIGGQHFFAGRRTKKGVTGYDVMSLLVGSEGTLALFDQITLRLVPRPERTMTLLALFGSFNGAADAVGRIVAQRIVPRCIEFFDQHTLAAMREGGNAIDADARAMLLIEVDGSEAECERDLERVGGLCDEAHAESVLVAQSEGQRERLWAARKEMSLSVRRLAKHKLSEDVVVPRRRLGDLLDRVDRMRDEFGVQALSYGHAGDGNLHVNFLWNEQEERLRVERAVRVLFEATVELGGTLSGEHGIGVLKAPYLPIEQTADLIDLQRDLKRAFDPLGLLNPGKIFPRHHAAC